MRYFRCCEGRAARQPTGKEGNMRRDDISEYKIVLIDDGGKTSKVGSALVLQDGHIQLYLDRYCSPAHRLILIPEDEE